MIPTDAVEVLKSATDVRCHAVDCRDYGCSLDLSDAPTPSILISLESEFAGFAANETRCDYLFVGESDGDGGFWVAPIELTTGRKRAHRFFLQLSAGAGFADSRLPQNIAVRFRPIAVHSIPLHPREYHLMRTYLVPFRNDDARIRIVSCGDKLADALSGV